MINIDLQRETSRRKIERLRWYHSGLINNAGLINQSISEDQIDNPLKNDSNVLTLSVFARPCGGVDNEIRYHNKEGQ